MQRVLKANKVKGGGRLWLPESMVKAIPPESRFIPEFTEQGILFRLVKEERPAVVSWTTT